VDWISVMGNKHNRMASIKDWYYQLIFFLQSIQESKKRKILKRNSGVYFKQCVNKYASMIELKFQILPSLPLPPATKFTRAKAKKYLIKNEIWKSFIILYRIFFFNIIQVVPVKRDPLDRLCCVFLYTVFVLTCLRMAYVQVETCSRHVKVTSWIKIYLYCVGLISVVCLVISLTGLRP